MVTRTVIIDTEEHAKEFDTLMQKLAYIKQVRQLKAEDVALGIGAPYTKEELDVFLQADDSDQTNFNLVLSIQEIKRKLKDA